MIKREQIYKQLRESIINGELNPGIKLIEAEICKRFNVGRTPLREAFYRLQSEGYIEISPNKSAAVRNLPTSELDNLYDILAVLESYAVETSTRLLSEKNKEKLKKLVIQSDKINDPSEFKKWREFNATFHEFFWENSGNPVLYNQLANIRKMTYRTTGMIMIPILLGNLEKYKDEHRDIANLVLNGEAVKARNKMKIHVLKAKGAFIKYLKNE